MHSSVKIQRLKVNLMLHDIPQHDLIYSMNETAVYVSVLVFFSSVIQPQTHFKLCRSHHGSSLRNDLAVRSCSVWQYVVFMQDGEIVCYINYTTKAELPAATSRYQTVSIWNFKLHCDYYKLD